MHFTHQPLYIVPNHYKDPLYEPARQYKQNCDQIIHIADQGDTEFRVSDFRFLLLKLRKKCNWVTESKRRKATQYHLEDLVTLQPIIISVPKTWCSIINVGCCHSPHVFVLSDSFWINHLSSFFPQLTAYRRSKKLVRWDIWDRYLYEESKHPLFCSLLLEFNFYYSNICNTPCHSF